MDATKSKKLEEYALVLEKQAQTAEGQGNLNEAAKFYVKLIDIFLLLARESPDHPTWARYASRAEALQKKTKEMIASAESKQAGKGTSIKKIFGLGPNEEKNASREKPENSEAQTRITPNVSPTSQAIEQMVPKRLYDQVLEKAKQLDSRLASMVDRSDYEGVQNQCRNLEERIASFPAKSEYEDMRQKLSNSVSRTQYEELQRAFVNLIPKDTYDAAQARIAELESQLENSIPKSVMDNLANEVSLLAVTASIPIPSVLDSEIGSQAIPRDNEIESTLWGREAIEDGLEILKRRMDALEMKIRSVSDEELAETA